MQDAIGNATHPWFDELRELVQAKLDESVDVDDDRRPALTEELGALNARIEGWEISLGLIDVPHTVRESLHRRIEEASRRKLIIEEELRLSVARQNIARTLVNESTVRSNLDRLAATLAEESPTLCNLMLSQHIDRIVVHPDGRAVMRTCKLGSTPDAVPLLRSVGDDSSGEALRERAAARTEREARRRTLLSVDRLDPQAAELLAAADMAADPDRFAGLPDEFFWTDEFIREEVPTPCWSAENATRVAEFVDTIVAENGKEPSMSSLARQFGVANATVKKALAFARGEAPRPGLRKLRSQKVAVKGNAELEAEILRLFDVEGLQIKEVAARIGCAKNAVSDALDRQYAAQGRTRPDARTRNSRTSIATPGEAPADVGRSS